MKNTIQIFKEKNLKIDLPTFIDSRALICANSGGGKSYAVRKILEEANDKVLCIVLDIEGEFRTLREQYDFLLIGENEGDDVPLSMKSAKLLPEKIVGLDISTIVDISDLKRNDRIKYVKDFLESLMQLKRKEGMWKPCLIVLDEVHQLAGQQEKQDSTSAVIDLATRGRKRGYCMIGCTQRISKLHKDVVAELNNYMVGRTGLDIDMQRAKEILGFTSKQDMLSLRDLEAGEFYVFGTAISRNVIKAKVSEVKTTHPKVGMDLRKEVIPPTDKIKKQLSKLVDLPKEQEKKLKEIQDYKKEINELRRELRKKPKPEIDEMKVKEVSEKNYKIGYDKGIKDTTAEFQDLIKNFRIMKKKLEDIGKILDKEIIFKKIEQKPIEGVQNFEAKRGVGSGSDSSVGSTGRTRDIVGSNPTPSIYNEDIKLRAGAIRILNFVAMFGELTKEKAKTLCGISSKGTFGTYVADLSRSGLINVQGNILKIKDEGIDFIGEVEEMPTDTESLINLWSKHLRAGAISMLRICVNIYPDSINKKELQEEVGIQSNGTFGTYIADLRRNGLIKINGQEVKASGELFE